MIRIRLEAAFFLVFFFCYVKKFTECSDKKILLNNIDYSKGSSLAVFCDKFFDEVISPFFEKILDAFPSGTLSKEEGKEYLKECHKLWQYFSRQAKDEYSKRVCACKWQGKPNTMVNYRLQFSTQRSNAVRKLIRRQYDSQSNLIMQTALYVPNLFLYKQLKEPCFHNCLRKAIFSELIENAGKLFVSLRKKMKNNFADSINKILLKLLSVINQQADGKNVFKELRKMMLEMFFENVAKFDMYYYLTGWISRHIQNVVLCGIISTANRLLLSINPSEMFDVPAAEYDDMHPRWIEAMEESELKEKCIFAHILAVDSQLFINMVEIEREVMVIFLNEFITYFQKFLSAKVSFYIVDGTEYIEATTVATKLQQLHNDYK